MYIIQASVKYFLQLLIVLVFTFFTIFIAKPTPISAQSQECTDAYLRNIGVSVVTCSGDDNQCAPVTTGPSLPEGSSIYVLGDSITLQSKTEIQNSLEAPPRNYVVSSINADGGRAITSDTYPTNNVSAPTGLEVAVNDSAIISGSKVVVIALGTNSGGEDLTVQVPAQLQAIRNTGFTGPIFWVNTFYTYGGTAAERNTVIANSITQDPLHKTSIIDTFGAGIQLQSDKTHPTLEGQKQFAEVIANGLQDSSTSTSTPTSTGSTPGGGSSFEPFEIVGGGSADGNPTHILSYLEGIDEQKAADAINVYIQQKQPTSPFVGLGAAFVAGAKKYNVNPFLPVGHIKVENGFATASSGWHTTTPPSYNAFGRSVGSRTGGQPYTVYTGSGGRERLVFKWSSWQASLDGNNGTEDPWFGLINRKYLAKDYTGGFAISSGDFETYLSHYAPQSDGNNEASYINGLKTTIDEIIALMGTGVSFAGSAVAGCGQQPAAGQGVISTDGYAFPLAPQTKAVGGIGIGQTASTHHDDTAAFDLFSGTGGAAVYSIFPGTPDRINTNFNKVQGCSSIQFRADDGLYYWYGHLKNVTAQVGVHVDAGVKIAEIADSSFGSACIGGGPHLHIDRGCTINGIPQRGGGDKNVVATATIPKECRDPSFIPFLSKIYESLP